jgi:hypothetical protein
VLTFKESTVFSSLNKFAVSAVLTLTLTVLVDVTAFSQSQSINGSIRGEVTDATGAPISAAHVNIKNTDTGFTRDVKTDSAGLYVVPDLPLGAYTITVDSPGFAPVKNSGIHLEAGMEAVVDEHMKPGTVTTEVEVTADASVIQPARFEIGSTINPVETANIPLSSRNPYNFVLFQPGVSGVPNAELGIPDFVNTNGLVDRVNYELDGMQDTETDEYGLRLYAISDSYVREVQTVSNAFAPEFGNTDGNIYNAVTGSGTNDVHGVAQFIWRPTVAASRPMLLSPESPTPDSTLSNPSGSVGGPILKNKLFYYGAYEYILRGEPSPITISPTNAALIGLPTSELGTAPEVEHATFVDARADWNISAKNTFFVRYNYFRNVFPYNSDVGGLFALSASSNFQDRAQIIGAQLVTAFSSNLLNEFRGSWPYRNEKHINAPTTGTGPMVDISGVAEFNGTNIDGTKFQEKIPSFSDNFTWIKGKHTMKFGVGYLRPLLTQFSAIYSEYVFPSVTDYLEALPTCVAGGPNTPICNPQSYSALDESIGTPGAGFQANFWDLFAQDTWQLRKNILINYGYRYDLYLAPKGIANAPFADTDRFRTPKGDFAPRLGISWMASPSTVVRANMGMFYIQPPTDVWYNSLFNDGGASSIIADIAPGTSCSPSYPNNASVTGSCLGVLSITATTPNFKNEYTWNGNLQISQQIAKNDSIYVSYVMTNGRNIQYEYDMNMQNPIAFLADGRPVYSSQINATTRVNPNFNNITLQAVGSNSSYNALLAGYEHRWSSGFLARANYTWGHSLTDAPEVSNFDCDGVVEDPSDRDRDRSNSCVDRPNAFTLSSVYEPQLHSDSGLLNGIVKQNQFVTTWNFLAGVPQNVVANHTLNNDTITSAYTRPLFVSRDTARGPSIYQVDLRYTRGFGEYHNFRPQIFVEANNLLNRHSNVTTLNETATVNPLPSVCTAGTAAGDASCAAAITAAATNGATVGAITGAPTQAFESTLLQSRILQFGFKVAF